MTTPTFRQAASGLFLPILIGTVLLSGRHPGAAQATDPFADFIRKSEPLTAEQERTRFHVPPGFEVQLVASEPDIAKPMNMAFDSRGRLWVAESREYPYAAPLDQPARDAIKVLSDFDEQGRAKKITTFASGLNIPIGLYPYKDGVIAFSIPNIYSFMDTNGDGRSDQQQLILGRFGFEKDTHGLTSSFRRGYDGWIYADHGFNNDSTLLAGDGSHLQMNSGNTYRFRPDGSRVERFTWGQVNPFGLMFDPLGDLWSADCHSSPVYQLLRGAYYPSFGKPHDGLGFAPQICAHAHGSTAIAGMVYYAAEQFPAEYRGNTFVGNVMSCRINRDSFREQGSTRLAKEEPDFLSSDDSWFRPVDLQLGPDGALYVADFYNRIIGHYEVPLDHPGRDRERGRIWRIVYRGTDTAQTSRRKASAEGALKGFDLSRASARQLIAELADPNLTRRMLAMNELIDRVGRAAVSPMSRTLKSAKATASQKAHGLWVLHRLGGLEDSLLTACAQDPQREPRVHAMRVLGETALWNPQHRSLALGGLKDADPYVRRAAADAIGRHPHYAHIRAMLDLVKSVPGEDVQLRHVARMALRDQLGAEGNFGRLLNMVWSEPDSRAIADVAVAIPSVESANFLLKHVTKFAEERDKLSNYLRHIARYVPANRFGELAAFTQKAFDQDIDFQLALFKSVQQGIAERGATMDPAVQNWGAQLAARLFESIDASDLEWRNSPIKGNETANPWVIEKRPSADGDQNSWFISSLSPGGEKLTGVLRSKLFTVPARLSFFLAGHDGAPERGPAKRNLVRLREVASQAVLAQSTAPRNDVAQPITWELGAAAGKSGYLEIVDGNSARAYAWLAIGRFEPAVVDLPKVIPNQVDKRQLAAAEIAGGLRLTQFEKPLTQLMREPNADVETRVASVQALGTIAAEAHLAEMKQLLSAADEPRKVREKVAEVLGNLKSAPANAALVEALRVASSTLQKPIGLALASSTAGAEALLGAVAEGKASARLLQDPAVKDRVVAAKPVDAVERLTGLTRHLTPASDERQKLIDQRRTAFNNSNPSASQGAAVFKQHCSVCHALDGQGSLIGPQLDGVGGRGLERLLEDIVDPNRNVDKAFRTSLFILQDGEVQSGLFRREEGETLIVAESTGKEVSVPKSSVKERRESEISLMPDNVSEVMSAEDFNHLLAYLLSKEPPPAAERGTSRPAARWQRMRLGKPRRLDCFNALRAGTSRAPVIWPTSSAAAKLLTGSAPNRSSP